MTVEHRAMVGLMSYHFDHFNVLFSAIDARTIVLASS